MNETLFRRQLIDCIEKITEGWRDYEAAHQIVWKPLPDDPFLQIAYRDLAAFLSEDPMWWDNPDERGPLWIDLALLKQEDISSDQLLECRSTIASQFRRKRLSWGDKDEIEILAGLCSRSTNFG